MAVRCSRASDSGGWTTAALALISLLTMMTKRERSSANLKACSLLGVLLTVASDEAPKLRLEEEEEDEE
jgi:hypothetical protein